MSAVMFGHNKYKVQSSLIIPSSSKSTNESIKYHFFFSPLVVIKCFRLSLYMKVKPTWQPICICVFIVQLAGRAVAWEVDVSSSIRKLLNEHWWDVHLLYPSCPLFKETGKEQNSRGNRLCFNVYFPRKSCWRLTEIALGGKKSLLSESACQNHPGTCDLLTYIYKSTCTHYKIKWVIDFLLYY